MDRYATTCPCTCHGRGPDAPCDPEHTGGCGHLHASTAPAQGCPACLAPTADDALCVRCTTRLTNDLAQVPELIDEVETWRIKLDRIGGRDVGTSGSDEVPLGYRPMAVEVHDVLHLTLATWAASVADAAGLSMLGVPAQHPAQLAGWLAGQVEPARHMPGVAAYCDEVGYAVRVTRRAIDRPADRVYAGPCDQCQRDLYAGGTADVVTCHGCGTGYGVRERRAWLLDGLREHLATAAEIAAGIGELYGTPVNRKTINVWHHRERLVERGSTRNGWPLFRIGDVLELAGQVAARAASPTRAGLTARSAP